MSEQMVSVVSDNIPAAVGPYSAAVKANGLVFVSGQLPVDPKTGALAGNDIRALARQSLVNLSETLRAAGSSMEQVVKTTVFLTDLSDFAAVNEVYASFFSETCYPARSCFQVASLPKGSPVEIEAIALL